MSDRIRNPQWRNRPSTDPFFKPGGPKNLTTEDAKRIKLIFDQLSDFFPQFAAGFSSGSDAVRGGPVNYLQNGGFEQDTASPPVFWATSTPSGGGTSVLTATKGTVATDLTEGVNYGAWGTFQVGKGSFEIDATSCSIPEYTPVLLAACDIKTSFAGINSTVTFQVKLYDDSNTLLATLTSNTYAVTDGAAYITCSEHLDLVPYPTALVAQLSIILTLGSNTIGGETARVDNVILQTGNTFTGIHKGVLSGSIKGIPPAKAVTTPFDAYIDPFLSASVASSHTYKNLTDLLANETPTSGKVFNIGLIPRGNNNICTEPGNINFTSASWPAVNLQAITQTPGSLSNTNPPMFYWTMPTITHNQAVTMSGVHVTGGSVVTIFSGLGAAVQPLTLVNCFFGSGQILTDGDLYAYHCFLNVQNRLSSGSTNSVELWDCYWNGTVTQTVWANTAMYGGYLNGGIVTGGTGKCIINSRIDGAVQVGNTGQTAINNLGSRNGSAFTILANGPTNVDIRGTWSQVVLRTSGHQADIKISQDATPTNPAIQFISATHCKVSADVDSGVTGAQAYTFDAGSTNNLLTLGGSHAAHYTVASTDSGTSNHVITDTTDSLTALQTGQEVAYGQNTAGPITVTSTTEATPTIIATATAFTFDGTSAFWFEIYAPQVNNTGTVNWTAGELYEGAGPTDYCTIALQADPLGVMYGKVKLTPTAGSKTFKFGCYKNGAGNTSIVQAGNGGSAQYAPAFIRVTRA